ncbi:hypothetical protein Aconfl_33400 [Algoriphagus confluentis]|uniref:Uncharacterized protein n=2 Tax=Algoriphagus confluentis TaxID=1697556 RepID=A0ABQ6PVD1_9BACT|nr:hypothetical protein Aconfl_33400 [Algoriphagus confluentis]
MLAIFGLFLILGFFSCQSEDNDLIPIEDELLTGEYHVNAKIDGIQKDFPFTFCGKFEDEGNFSLLVGGTSGQGDSPEPALTIVLEKGGDILVGNYTVNSNELSAEYVSAVGEDSFYASSVVLPKDFSLKITAINEKKIRGTFQGTFKNGNGQTLTLTEGSFFLPITIR